MLVVMGLCAASAIGSYSRGAILALAAMLTVLWFRSRNKLQAGLLIVLLALPLLAFMPEQWSARMTSIQNYDEDSSATGRINAWYAAWNIATHYVQGAGFNPATPQVFARFAPDPTAIHAAHSIYFQVLGNHGFIGLFLFLGIYIATWQSAGWLRNQKNLPIDAAWCRDMGAMCQVALAGYAVGGAFLSLAYFDLPYNIMSMVVLTRVWVEKQSWKTEPLSPPKWMQRLGLAAPQKEADKSVN